MLRYLARVFVTGTDRPASAANFGAFAKALGRDDYLPLPFNEVGPSGVHARIGLCSADATRLVFVRSESVDFEYRQPRDPNHGRPSLADFCQDGGELLSHALDFLEARAHRIAALQEGLLREMPAAAMDSVARKLLAIPPRWAGQAPFEWDWRAAVQIERQFGGDPEVTNTIATVKRLSGKFNDGAAFDRLFVAMDVNTTPGRTEPRFDEGLVRGFFGHAAAWHDELGQDVLAFCGVLDDA
ncbi:MAG: hypothetical protein HY744_26345 [Deltaproteobacteria bacterium]|nr:hypothetical protein [Deltaproteobacteria bacterium]